MNNLLNNPPATLLANPPEYIALDAKVEAWLNLSHLENASVFVIVRTSAMANRGGDSQQVSLQVHNSINIESHLRSSIISHAKKGS